MNSVQIGDEVRDCKRLSLNSFHTNTRQRESTKGCQLCFCNFITTAHSSIDHLVKLLTGSVPSILTLLLTFNKVGNAQNDFFSLRMWWHVEVSDLRRHLLCDLVSGPFYSTHQACSLMVNLFRFYHFLIVFIATQIFFKVLNLRLDLSS